ncbi:hypothetical protein QYM36_001802 [Artemia franciscana]|uniref:Carbonic anhydrase n=2 Tax=Artemia franciscana TaxID=6661 RepID=A0AA88IMA7_ARTSF|nr:hypothetical protein QYM36_001802 [Artemia franciscana]
MQINQPSSNTHLAETDLSSFIYRPFLTSCNLFKETVSMVLQQKTGLAKTLSGPLNWVERYPIAAGERQSPIDITTDSVVPDPDLPDNPLKWDYPKTAKVVTNTGYGWRVDVDGSGSSLSGGPLEEKYEIVQFHCHWGHDESCGSEHTVDGEAFPAELHLVHRNLKYETMEEALNYADGLSVLGVFLTVGEENQELQKIVDILHEIKYKDESVKLESPIDPLKLLPDETAYWTYPGSLTTPPLSECVIWLVLREKIQVSIEQLEAFRQMCCNGKCDEQKTLPENFRPPQPKNHRCIRSSVA